MVLENWSEEERKCALIYVKELLTSRIKHKVTKKEEKMLFDDITECHILSKEKIYKFFEDKNEKFLEIFYKNLQK